MSTTQQWFREGGPVMWVLLLVAVVGLGVLFERMYVIVVRSKNNGRTFIERVIQLVRGGKVDEAIKACASSTAALPDIGLLILRSRSRDESDLTNVSQAAALAVVPKLTHRIQYLPTLSLVAVLIGMAGTIHGIHDALLSSGSGAESSSRLAAGVAAALTPTAFALLVSAVLMLGRSYLVSQAEAITEEIHEFSARLINALIDRPDVRLGHR